MIKGKKVEKTGTGFALKAEGKTSKANKALKKSNVTNKDIMDVLELILERIEQK